MDKKSKNTKVASNSADKKPKATTEVNVDKKKQDLIADFLFKIDSLINNYKKIIKTYNSMLDTAYAQYFELYKINDELIYSKELKKNIPSKWKVGKIKDFADVLSGYAFKTSEYVKNGKHKLYTIKNVQDGKIITKVDNYINEISKAVPEYCKLKKGDMLLSLTGNVGRVAIVFEDNALLNQRVGLIMPKNTDNRGYIYSVFNSIRMKNTLVNISTGTSQKNLSPIDTQNLYMIIPDQDTLNKYNEYANYIFDQITDLNYEINNLETLKEYIVPLIFNGQIKIEE